MYLGKCGYDDHSDHHGKLSDHKSGVFESHQAVEIRMMAFGGMDFV